MIRNCEVINDVGVCFSRKSLMGASGKLDTGDCERLIYRVDRSSQLQTEDFEEFYSVNGELGHL